MMISKKISTIFVIFLLTFSTACVETVVVGSAATAIVVTRIKTMDETRKDVTIATKLASDFLQNGLKTPTNSVDIMVNEGRVLLTGILDDQEKAKLASELAWKVSGVKEVIDEIQIRDESLKLKDVSKGLFDYFLSAKVETRLFFARKVMSRNYKITTVGKTVYLLGVAVNQTEMDKVLSIVSKISGVEKVVNHVILADDSRRG